MWPVGAPALVLSNFWAVQSRNDLARLTPGRPAPVTREPRSRIAVLPVIASAVVCRTYP